MSSRTNNNISKQKSNTRITKSSKNTSTNLEEALDVEDKTYLDNIIDDYRLMLLNYDPKKNKTRPIMSKYEKAFVIGKRASQIERGAEPLIDVPIGVESSVEIAEMELYANLTPFIVERDLGNGKKEIWKIADMIITRD
jgi:DNA-directed RNA polymerase subunit K/omega